MKKTLEIVAVGARPLQNVVFVDGERLKRMQQREVKKNLEFAEKWK